MGKYAIPVVMGIVNVTPDSFSDGGKYATTEEAVRRARNMIEEGAGIIDVGGESTRPGAVPLDWRTEWERIRETVEILVADARVPVSVDTYHPETAALAIEAGASIVNCVYAEPVPEICGVVEKSGRSGISLVVPASYAEDVIARGGAFNRDNVYFDPMIGFGTTREEDLAILRSIGELSGKGKVLVGASRKRIVKKLTGVKTPGKDLAGNLAIAAWCAMNGVAAIRVHDVRETVQMLAVLSLLSE